MTAPRGRFGEGYGKPSNSSQTTVRLQRTSTVSGTPEKKRPQAHTASPGQLPLIAYRRFVRRAFFDADRAIVREDQFVLDVGQLRSVYPFPRPLVRRDLHTVVSALRRGKSAMNPSRLRPRPALGHRSR